MKIIQMIYSLSSGGAEKFVVDLSNELAVRGHEVTLCMLLADDNSELVFNKQFLSNKVNYHNMGFARGFSLKKVNAVQQFVKRLHPDVVHCHLNVTPYIFRLALTNRKIKFVHTLHSVAQNAVGAGYQRFINKMFYKYGVIQAVCISRLCMESYNTFYHLNNAPYIDNGRALMPPTKKIEAVKKEVTSYQATMHTPIFIHVARFDKLKNQHLLIDSFNALNKEGVDFTLLIIGNGFNSDMGKQLQIKACNKIHFLGEKDNVNDYLLCSDAFCLTSIFEGLPISLLEALSCGVTPICTPVGGIPDVIKDGENGYLSQDLTIDNYVKVLKYFIAQPIEKQTLKNFYAAHYSMHACAEKYEHLFQSF